MRAQKSTHNKWGKRIKLSKATGCSITGHNYRDYFESSEFRLKVILTFDYLMKILDRHFLNLNLLILDHRDVPQMAGIGQPQGASTNVLVS